MVPARETQNPYPGDHGGDAEAEPLQKSALVNEAFQSRVAYPAGAP